MEGHVPICVCPVPREGRRREREREKRDKCDASSRAPIYIYRRHLLQVHSQKEGDFLSEMAGNRSRPRVPPRAFYAINNRVKLHDL